MKPDEELYTIAHLLSGLAKLSLQDGQPGIQLLNTVTKLCICSGQGGLLQSQGAHLLLQLLLTLLQYLPEREELKKLSR